jgi:hypothetical protein
MELVDALCSNVSARSVVELSLNPCFRREHSALYKAVAACQLSEQQLAHLAAPYLPEPRERSFRVLGVDVTSQPRPFAHTLDDRGFVYQPNAVKGNKPVTIGHQYSTVTLLPERSSNLSGTWVVPLVTRRVPTSDDAVGVGAEQMDALLSDTAMLFQGKLCVEVGDTSYSKPGYLHANRHHPNLVTITRVRGNRVFYRRYVHEGETPPVGHPRWYGARFSLKDPDTWPTSDEEVTITHLSRRGRQYRVVIQAWHDMLMRGRWQPQLIPMHKYPFTLVRACLYDETGALALRPLWLIVVGERRAELSPQEVYQVYNQRSDQEQFFRFGKQRLLLTAFQTPEVAREEQWWRLVHLAYLQLWVARRVAQCLPRPWERYLPTVKAGSLTPTWVQRDFGRITQQLGTPTQPAQPRGISPGRPPGTRMPRRKRHSIVWKGKKASPST